MGSRSLLLVTWTRQGSAEVCTAPWSVVSRDVHWGWKPLFGTHIQIYVPNNDDLEKQWKANSWSCTSFGTWSSLWFVYLKVFQCCKCVTRVKRFPLDSLAELWAIVIRRVVLRMVRWSQSGHPWTFIASIFCGLGITLACWVVEGLLRSHQLTMKSYADNFSTRGLS